MHCQATVLEQCKVCLRGTWVDKLWLLLTSAVLSEESYRWNSHGFFRSSVVCVTECCTVPQ